jgi:hypothetical protein
MNVKRELYEAQQHAMKLERLNSIEQEIQEVKGHLRQKSQELVNLQQEKDLIERSVQGGR